MTTAKWRLSIQKIEKTSGSLDPKFHYVRRPNGQIKATLATVQDPSQENITYVGLAHVSPNEVPAKSIGRAVAKGRALKRLAGHSDTKHTAVFVTDTFQKRLTKFKGTPFDTREDIEAVFLA